MRPTRRECGESDRILPIERIPLYLTLFPDKTGEACVQEPTVLIPIGDGNETKIASLLTASLSKSDMYFPSSPCVTNIDTGVLQAAKDPGLADKAHEAFTQVSVYGARCDDLESGKVTAVDIVFGCETPPEQ